MIFNTSCRVEKAISSSNEAMKEELNLFFSELLLDHGGIYTLHGKKPMTIESIFYYDDSDFDQIEQYLKAHPEIQSQKIERYIDETLSTWKEYSNNLEMHNFLIAEIFSPNSPGKESSLLFINIKETILSIQKYYPDFREAYGRDFDPVLVVEGLRRGENEFWNMVIDHKALLGILLGYGYNNAWSFKRKSDGQNGIENLGKLLKKDNAQFRLAGKLLDLPSFAKFDLEESEEILKQYEKDRNKIHQLYMGNSFLDVTLQALEN